MSCLLAVDLGLRTGLALFGQDGRLVWYRSQHYGTRTSLRRGAHGLLETLPGLARMVLEGGGPIAAIWVREALRRRVAVRQISAEDWRARLFDPTAQRGRARSKESALAMARRVIEWSEAAKPTSLRHDAAEAILIGLWGVLDAGWLQRVPVGLD
jgi:hypothetical protein